MVDGTYGILLFDGEKNRLFCQSKDDQELWTIGEFTDEEAFRPVIKERFVVNRDRINPKEVGFVYSFKGSQMVIKMKDMSQKRSIGAKMDDAGKPMILKYLAGVTGDENLYRQKGKKRVFMNISLCVILEILMRWITENHRISGEPLYFFNAEIAHESNIIGLQI